MKYSLLFLALVIFISCGSRKVDKQSTKEYYTVELLENFHNGVEELEFSKTDVLTHSKEYDSLSYEDIKLIYEGKQIGDVVLIEKTDVGLKIMGSGKISLERNKESRNKSNTILQIEVDSLSNQVKSDISTQNKLSKSTEKKELNKKTEFKMFRFLDIIFVSIIVVYSIFLIWKLKKS